MKLEKFIYHITEYSCIFKKESEYTVDNKYQLDYQQEDVVKKMLGVSSLVKDFQCYLNTNLYGLSTKIILSIDLPSSFIKLNVSCTTLYFGSFLKACDHTCISSSILPFTGSPLVCNKCHTVQFELISLDWSFLPS